MNCRKRLNSILRQCENLETVQARMVTRRQHRREDGTGEGDGDGKEGEGEGEEGGGGKGEGGGLDESCGGPRCKREPSTESK